MNDSTSSNLLSNSVKRHDKNAWIASRFKNGVSKPIFIIMGFNGGPIVEEVLTRMGWQKAIDKHVENFSMMWTEVLAQVNFYRVKPFQLVNHIPNCGIMTNKLGLLLSLRGYEKYCRSIERQNKLHMNDFIPTTFVIDDLNERVSFYKQFHEPDIWICKPVGSNQGKGISLIRNIQKFKSDMLERENTAKQFYSVQARIVQKYITNPLLIYGRKFDIRSYMLIASTIPYVVLFCPGYVRLSMNIYSNSDENLVTHLTNQFVQKKSPKYSLYKEETVMNMEGFNTYFNNHCRNLKNFKENWVSNELKERMKDITHHVFKSVKQRLANSTSFFELFGFDFMVDDDLKVWLIEANSNPSMSTHCNVLQRTIPYIVEEALRIVIECFEKNTILNKPILPLENLRNFQQIYVEEGPISKTRRNANTSLKSWTAPRFFFSAHQELWIPDRQTDNSELSHSHNESLTTRLLKPSIPKRFPVNEKFFEKIQKKNSSSLRSLSPKTTSSNLQRGTKAPLPQYGRSLTAPRSLTSTQLSRQNTRESPINTTGDINSFRLNTQLNLPNKVSTGTQTIVATQFIKNLATVTDEQIEDQSLDSDVIIAEVSQKITEKPPIPTVEEKLRKILGNPPT